MLLTPNDARAYIKAAYPDMPFRMTSRSVTIGVRPVSDPRPTLVWQRVARGKDSVVRIGTLLPNLTIDWS